MDILSYDIFFSLLTLTFLEIILGIDNLIFIALVVQKLPQKFRKTASAFGLSLAFIIRILMLLALSWIMGLTKPLFHIGDIGFSHKDFLLIAGGVFLIVKSGGEIARDAFLKEKPKKAEKEIRVSQNFLAAVLQIAVIDFIFSFDSVITAVGMTSNIPVIVTAITIAMIVMFFSASHITGFLSKYPSLKIVALAFIFLVGVILLADGLHLHISKAYLYFALFFTITVESINIIARKKHIK
jgi:predicted tellurium resistance membrane protein TerC